MTYNSTRRRKFTQAQRSAFIELHGHICWWCGQPILRCQPWDIEHQIARELMEGKDADADDNLKPIHSLVCHPKKTALDRQQIAHSNRIRRKNGPVELRRKTKPIPSRKAPIPSRPFARKP